MKSSVKLNLMSANESRAAGMTKTPRTGRRPGQESGTREAIVAAAERLFLERGYEGASMRAIGAAAGVDAALVTHFFGGKANLLAAAVGWPFDPDVEVPRLLAGGRDQVGRRVVRLFTRTWDDRELRDPIITLLRAAATEPQAAELVDDMLRTRLFRPLLAALGSDRPDLRANLAASQLVGLGMTRYILGFEPLASARSDRVIAWVAPTVQRYLVGDL
ncbi:MAG: TetR/AcrR family transcriptional regulator [Solirubrobacteraceae bacterium]